MPKSPIFSLLKHPRRAITLGFLICSGFTLPFTITSLTTASASTTVRTCSYRQLEVGVAWGPGAAAGHIGIPFIIANTSKSTCSLEGFPKLNFGSAWHGKSIKVVNGGSMIYPSVKPRLILIRPGRDASFGIDFGDASNQGDPYGAACSTSFVYITLPVRTDTFDQNFETPINFNFCYADFEVYLTSIQAGPMPREG
jgi:hypothetical protein